MVRATFFGRNRIENRRIWLLKTIGYSMAYISLIEIISLDTSFAGRGVN